MEQKIDAFASRLGDPGIDLKQKVNIATELRDVIETICSSPAYRTFLAKLWPVFRKILHGEPVFAAVSLEQKLRNCILEIIHRLHMNSSDIEPYAAEMVDKLMELARTENEDNAVLCMKTIMDLERHQIAATAPKVQPFLDLIQEMFRGMEQVVKDTFDTGQSGSIPGTSSEANVVAQNLQSPRPNSPANSVAELGSDQQANSHLLKGMQSFKVLAECPIIVVSVFQAHRNSVSVNVKKFVPLIKQILLLQASPQAKAHEDAARSKQIFTGVCREIKNRSTFGEFITAQVKTMSFLAYLLRMYGSLLTDFLPSLPDVVVRLLKDCPREKSGARKELLVAIRHIINFNYRRIFLPKIDELLDERTLIGDGLTVYETMRPLAYSMLADLIHHVRESLNRDQIRKTVEVYTKNLHDNFPGTSFQTMSAKLLLNMAESITKLEDKEEARYFLVMILDAIGDKFAAMNYQYQNARKLTKQYTAQTAEPSTENYLADKDLPPDWDEIDIFAATPIKTSNPRDRAADPVADNKFLFKNLVNGLKNMFFQLKTCNPSKTNIDPQNAPVNWGEVSFGYNAEEVRVITKLFHEGVRVFRYYNTEQPAPETQHSSAIEFLASHYMSQMGKDEKELLESFGTVFHCIDTATFHEIFHTEIGHLHELMFEHTALLHLPQFFLASEATSPAFAGMVLQYLMERIHEVGSADIIKASILLRMFKLSFMAVTLFSQQNEQVLLPHVTKIVTQCVQLSTTAEEPLNYFYLLRSLFRSIGGGRFELLYKEILPLLEMLLETFNHLLQGARKIQERELYVELTLTVPARLSHLLPHLSHLMRPLVVALRAGSDLIGQGLRTLELCVDNLTADYLDPIMAPIMDELMTSLWKHLQPAPYSHFHAHTTMRILGKLGGRNRKFLNHPPTLDYKMYTDDEPSMDIRLTGSNKDRAFPVDTGIDLAVLKLTDACKAPNGKPVDKATDTFYRQQAFKMISSQLKLYIGYDHLPDDLQVLLRMQANTLLSQRPEIAIDIMDRSEQDKSVGKLKVQETTLKKLLKACILSTTISEVKASAKALLGDVCRHFTIIEVGRALAHWKHKQKPFDVHSGEGTLYIDSQIMADAVLESFASDDGSVRASAEYVLEVIRDNAAIIFGSNEKASKLPFFGHLAKVFCHGCHELEWFTKAGGALGIQISTSKLGLGDDWLSRQQLDFVRALMFVVKDTPEDLPAATRLGAQSTLEVIIRRCNKGVSKDSISNEKSKLHQLCSLFVAELSHMNTHVRETAQHALTVIAAVAAAEIHELIAPVKDRLLQPIFNKPLRALPFSTQIGFIEAVTYSIGLHHNIVVFNEQLNRLIMESLALADAEDETLTSKPLEYNNAEMLIKLRVSCLKMLSLAMSLPEFQNALQSSNTRSRIISVFFKSLYSKSVEIIDASNAGLRDVLTQTNKLPKDLLQNGLRPILMNLQEPKRLSVAGLDGLARLLTLLTNYFKVEIGQRLLDHMKIIADETLLQKVSFGLIEQQKEMRIIAAVFNIFHLLPPTAAGFMDVLVNSVLDLEAKLRRTACSPFREPLIKYLNRYPKETLDYFQNHLSQESYGRFYGQILADPNSESIRRALAAEPESFVNTALTLENLELGTTASVNMIYALHSVCIRLPTNNWYQKAPDLKRRLLKCGIDLERGLRRDKLPPSQRLRVEQAGDQLMDIFTTYLALHPEDLDFTFEMLEAAATEKIKRTLALNRFLYNNLISSESIDFRKTIITRCLDIYGQKAITQQLKTFLFRCLVNPIIAMDIRRNFHNPDVPKLVDKAMVEMIHNRLWRPQLGEINEESSYRGIDHTRMEALQLSALLIKYHHTTVQDARKDVIKFAWNYIRLEDIINKYGAYVLISYFIAHYETPPKIALQIYIAMLKAHQNEGKALVTQALEILAQILPKRMPAGVDVRSPAWAKWPRRILSEETGNLQQVMSIFHFLVRQPDLFFESRENFVSIIVPSLQKIASPPNPSNESKKLALNLISLLWSWEKRRVEGISTHPTTDSSPSKKRRDEAIGSTASNSNTVTASAPRERAEYEIPVEHRKTVIKYLIQFITTLQERFPVPAAEFKFSSQRAPAPQPSNEMCKRAVQLLKDLLSPNFWSDLDVELYQKVTDPILASEKTDKPDEKHIIGHTTQLINTLQVVRVLLNTKNNEWILSHLTLIQRLLEKPLRMDNPEIQDCLHSEDSKETKPQIKPLVRQILDAIPDQQPDEEDAMDVDSSASEFVTFLSTIATETLSAGNYASGINILWTISKVKPAEIDTHVPAAMKALQSLAKDHMNVYAQPQVSGGPNQRSEEQAMDSFKFMLGHDLISKTIDLLAARMSSLGENRRPFLTVLASLVEKSQYAKLCNKVLDMVESWVFNSSDSWPTLKEKTAVLHKMLLFESRTDQTLLKKFLELVIRIYEDPKITRTELTVRLEHAFLIGTRAQDALLRNRFLTIFDRSLSRTVSSRLSYVLASQNWDTISDSFWLAQASHLIMGSVDMSLPASLHNEDFKMHPISFLYGPATLPKEQRKDDLIVEDKLETLVSSQKRFNQEIGDVRVRDVLEPLCHLQHTDSKLAYNIWVRLFPLCLSSLSREDRMDLEKGMVTLLTREYHSRQMIERPNVIQALLEGAARSKPRFKIPPHVMKHLSRTYDAWYTTLVTLEEYAINPVIDTPAARESNLDALVETYASLQEDDLFYGTWRRRCKFLETNAALSFEQQGMWDKAQHLYEAAQVKARTGIIPFSQGEYYLWEDHWIICAQKLQNWEILNDLARHENFNDLLLEAAWRNVDHWHGDTNREQLDTMIKSVSDAPTPRRVFFQAFQSLLKYHNKSATPQDFTRVCDEAIQLSLRKWHQLPKRITKAHIPVLQNFQQLVELHDASVICNSLSQTNERNLDTKSQELKLLLGAWRDRLPNTWDDINAWHDLVTWRQHVFHLINGTYLGLLPQNANNVASNSYAYRGYHETAWIINRFAHVARKHHMPEVCIAQLSKIYTLPNIEIQEAFLKLREQAKCHYQNPSELNSGLDVINNTNLNYFGAQQKAEFYTLKGMFLAKLSHRDDANEAFGVALYYDLRLPKAWAEWGQYSDRGFKEDPQNLELASNAVSCYLEAAGLYKNAKSRKLLSRILWLLSLDNEGGKIAKAFEDFKGETPVWYWTTFIPQLLTGLSNREGRLTARLLVQIAKQFPQALFHHLRTTREDLTAKRVQEAKQEQQKAAKQKPPTPQPPQVEKASSPDVPVEIPSRPGTGNAEVNNNATPKKASPKTEVNGDGKEVASVAVQKEPPKSAWDFAEEVMAGLKTSYPLLALSMETMTDQIQKHFKCPPDEDAYRLIVALLNDGLAYVGRAPNSYAQDVKLPPATEANIVRFAETVLPNHIRKSFEADFVAKRPTMYEYIHKLRKWRDKFEEKLDRRRQWTSLESYSVQLSDFRFLKFDNVEVPGQYLRHKDKNTDFIKIDRFLPNVDLIRGIGACHRRIKIRGHDGSIHPFAVQHPTARYCRREERILQLFRIFNTMLAKRKESRRRNLYFHLPLMIPVAPHIRLVQDDSSYISLQGAYEDHCRRVGMSKDEPILFMMERLRALTEMKQNRTPEQMSMLRTEILTAIQEKWVPNHIILDFFQKTYPNFEDFWLFRRQFSYQYAAMTFMTYVMHMSTRNPNKIMISRSTGDIWATELIPALSSSKSFFYNPDPVPFRLTPNIQTLIGPLAMEGIFTSAVMAIARCLTEPEHELDQQLSIFVKDEMIFWASIQNRDRSPLVEQQLREAVQANSDFVIKRAQSLANPPDGNLPASMTVIDIISQAVNPARLAQTEPLWMPYI
ncbi:MAG: hypothetical protein Q9160_007593 [Pyrenula sp. 1 TL-2023]